MAQLFGYALTLLPPSAVTTAIVGQFSGSKQQEVLVSHGSWLELLKMDITSRKVFLELFINALTVPDGVNSTSRSIWSSSLTHAISTCWFTKRQSTQFIRTFFSDLKTTSSSVRILVEL